MSSTLTQSPCANPQVPACQSLIGKGVAGSLDAMRLVLKLAARFAAPGHGEEDARAGSGRASNEEPSRKAKKKAKSRAKKKKELAGEGAAADAAGAEEPDRSEAAAARYAAVAAAETFAAFAAPTEGSVLSMDQGGRDRALDEDGNMPPKAPHTCDSRASAACGSPSGLPL